MFQILNEMSELVYVSDLETYDLLYINQSGREMFNIREKERGKCYRLLQGKDAPCEFCTNCRLKEDAFYTWEITNKVVGRHFLLKDKKIDWNGRKARVEIAFDMTEQEARRKAISDALEIQNLVTECAKRLYEADENENAMQDVLRMSCEYLGSDRVYIFEIQNGRMTNTHEWCAPGVKPQIHNLKDMPVSLIRRWKPYFEAGENVVVKNVEDVREVSPEEYTILKAQDIQSTIASPLLLHNELIGYVGVDNYSVQMKENTAAFLTAVGYFLVSMIRQQRTLAKLERMSYYDSLTGIKNRNAYMAKLEQKGPATAGVVYLDINGMNQINRELGHANGDDVLLRTAEVLRKVFSGEDCYRIGGDEFIVMCVGMAEDEFREKAQRLKNEFEFHEEFHVSMGASWKSGAEGLRSIVFEADAAMFRDKKAFYRGRALSGRYRSQTDDILDITDPQALQKMMKAGQFQVYYQPQIDLKTRTLTGAEALSRYRDEEGNLRAPDQFIPILEEARLISNLDFYMFERVCAQLKKWMEEGVSVVPVATNFSRHTLAVDGFAQHLQEICGRYGVSKELVEIEVTETVEADDRELFYHVIEQLKEKDFRISIDDFGVNNANLSLLTDVDFHILKIDKHVIETICDNRKAGLLVSALVDICHQMGITVIAEGVETEEQYKILHKMECDIAQGYLYGRPIPTEEFFVRFLSKTEGELG